MAAPVGNKGWGYMVLPEKSYDSRKVKTPIGRVPYQFG
jgi:hypothetical protein